MPTVLRKYLLYLAFDWAYSILVHPLPVYEITYFTSVALGQSNTASMAVKPLGGSQQSEFSAPETPGGDLELVVELDFVRIDPPLGRLSREQVRDGFNPSSILKYRVGEPNCKGP